MISLRYPEMIFIIFSACIIFLSFFFAFHPLPLDFSWFHHCPTKDNMCLGSRSNPLSFSFSLLLPGSRTHQPRSIRKQDQPSKKKSVCEREGANGKQKKEKPKTSRKANNRNYSARIYPNAVSFNVIFLAMASVFGHLDLDTVGYIT